MTKIFKVFFVLLQIVGNTSTYSQKLNGPESIVYHKKTKSYYLSSIYEQTISKIEKDSIPKKFVSTSATILGLKMHKNILYAALNFNKENDQVKGYNLLTNQEEFSLTVPNSKQLNDIEFDCHNNLYVSDREANIVYKINLSTKEINPIIDTIITPNGLFYDKKNNRLIICNTIENNCSIYSYNLKKNELIKLKETQLSYLDGITMDQKSNIYVTSWNKNWKESSLYKFSKNLETTTLLLKNNDGMADIFYSKELKSILIANIYSNSFKRIKL